MKKHLIFMILALMAFGAGSLQAQGGPPRKPGDSDDRRTTGKGKGKGPGGPGQTPATKVGPSGGGKGPGGGGKGPVGGGPKVGPGTPKTAPVVRPKVGPVVPKVGPKVGPVPKVAPKPGPGPGPAPVRKVVPAPTKIGPATRPVFPTVRKGVGPVVAPRVSPRVVNPPGPAGGPGAGPRVDPRAVRRVLALPPRRVAPAVVVRPPAPGVVVTPPAPRTLVRVYDSARNVVVVPAEDGQSSELPYIAVPILFAAGTAELLDENSAAELEAVAAALLEVYAQDQNARFVIEGHTSTDGEEADNLKLSKDRASRTYALLVSHYGVPAAVLSIKGYGEAYAEHPNGSEAELQLDRRVLVVRTQ
ncbi:MAG: OmpA family protein [Verrucomicrobiaceae bacterium]|nr:OmpA family protein [Verrucomicrobiaceae bacterium]